MGAADGLRRALKVSMQGASAIEGGSVFHSGIVLGKTLWDSSRERGASVWANDTAGVDTSSPLMN